MLDFLLLQNVVRQPSREVALTARKGSMPFYFLVRNTSKYGTAGLFFVSRKLLNLP